MKPRTPVRLLPLAACLCLSAAQGAEIVKLQTNIALNQPLSWEGGAVPGPADVMVWNSTFTSPGALTSLSQLGADLSVAGIRVSNVGGARNAAQTMVGFQDAGSVNTLTVGAQGIDLSAATQTFGISSRFVAAADQDWIITNANTNGSPAGFNNNEDLFLAAQGTGAFVNLNGHTITTSGNGQVTVTSGYLVRSGNLDVGNNLFLIQGGGNRTTNIAGDFNITVHTGAMLRLQSNSGFDGVSLVSQAPIRAAGGFIDLLQNNGSNLLMQTGPITLEGGSTLRVDLRANGATLIGGPVAVDGEAIWNVVGGGHSSSVSNFSGALTGDGHLRYRNTATNTNGFSHFTGDNSGFSGTLELDGGSNNRSLRLGSDQAGSANADWIVGADNILLIHGADVALGSLHGAGRVESSHPSDPASITVGSGHFSGLFADVASAPLSLVKTGPDPLLLSGPADLNGSVAVEGGLLTYTSATRNLGPVTVADGATFGLLVTDDFESLFSPSIRVAEGGTLAVDMGTFSGGAFAPLQVDALSFDGPATLRVTGGDLAVGNLALIESLAAVSGSENLTLTLPPRVEGTLAAVGNSLVANLTAVEQIRWTGAAGEDWDINPGTGTAGSLNWSTTVSDTATRYIEAANGSDAVRFTDAAGANHSVRLSTILSPAGIVVDNSAVDFTFSGPGGLAGSTGLRKTGSGSLTLANTGPNTYAGITFIDFDSTLRLGDGVTPGGGSLSGPIENEGVLVLNRPDDHDFSATLTGFGSLVKEQPNTVTFSTPADLDAPLDLRDGELVFSAGGLITGEILGSGTLRFGGGTMRLSGSEDNSHSGDMFVSAGQLRLESFAGAVMVPGTVTIEAGATMVTVGDGQFGPDSAIHMFGTSADPMAGGSGNITIARAHVNVSGALGQLVVRDEFTVTEKALVTNGILSIASGHNANIEEIEMASPTALLRIAGSGGPSNLFVGAGGIRAAGGIIEVKFNVNDQDASLHLGGDLVTTGNLAINNGNYTGTNLNQIVLSGTRTFDIGADTTTTVAPDFSGPGGLVKTGGGTLTLTAASMAAHEGDTTVQGGTLLVNGSLTGNASVAAGATLGGGGTIADVTVAGTLSPGGPVGALVADAVTMSAGSRLAWQAGDWSGISAGIDWDLLDAASLTLEGTAGNPITVVISGSPANFAEEARSFEIVRSASPIQGLVPNAVQIDASGFVGTGTWTVDSDGSSIDLVYSPGTGTPFSNWAAASGLSGADAAPGADPDRDGRSNLAEFALDGNPLSGAATGKERTVVATIGGQQVLTHTLPVRNGATFAGATEKVSGPVDGVIYRIQAGDEPGGAELVVTELTGADATAIQAGMPALSAGWSYRTFRAPGALGDAPARFLRAAIEPATP